VCRFASTYQMLRGTMVLFAGFFTIVILRRSLHTHHWLGMVLIMAGAALVGASSIISASKAHQNMSPLLGAWNKLSSAFSIHHSEQHDPLTAAGPSGASAPLFGDILVVLAQLVAALQFILEEKFLKKYKVPTLLAVGVEGCWGVLLCIVALPIFTVVIAPDGLPIDDAIGATREIVSNMPLAIAVVGSTVSIAFFNFFGISVTKHLSGAARATIDACRTLFIWLFSLQVGRPAFGIRACTALCASRTCGRAAFSLCFSCSVCA
jgi:drug/metabolite transporter (DMT)-like permease